MPSEIDATYRVVTPLFCAGADPTRPEIRLPSFKGVLRFWWRALAWSRCRGDLGRIFEEEAALFGSAGAGRSRVTMRLGLPDGRKSAPGKGLTEPGVRYLGYGLTEGAPGRERAYLTPPLTFTVHLRTRCLHERQLQCLRRAMIAMGVFGGLGARSRNGFGSLVLESLRCDDEETWVAPETPHDLGNKIVDLHAGGGPERFPEYTALSQNTRHVLLSSSETETLPLLNLVGGELKNAVRTVGRSQRVAFGLPRGRRKERRASPLFVHVHECGARPVVVLSFLPAHFLPDEPMSSMNRLYQPVYAFLDGLSKPVQRRQFTAIEIKP
ncbi:MAG: type III-B CRISPR module RAMP protein Cmr1 [Gammaproteobacteria bacterium]|nr:type III-B CRISPR module RAMP protein Cmr1 [Gammaproteobacteria bacterium]